MKPITKRLLSLLMALVLVLGLPSTAMAATDLGSSSETVAVVTEPSEKTAAVPTETAETDPADPTDPTEQTDPTEPTEATDSTEPTETEAAEPEETEGEVTGIVIDPEPIMEENPYDPDWPYPYGLPVDNVFPEEQNDGIMLLADMDAIPDEMYDNYILRALEYTGYDVQWLKDNGYLYVRQYVSSNLNTYAPQVLSGIGYDDYSPFLNGDETVADSSTVTGKAPAIATFESNGLVCASFVTYYLCNYLPNIEGIDTTWIHDAVKATTMNNGSYSTASVWSWETGLTNLANTAGSGVTKYTDATTAYANLVPGDVIIFSDSSGNLTHAAIYAGTYSLYSTSGTNGGQYHFIIHVGNSRGPEISAVEYMVSAGSKSSSPSAWYHIDLPEVESTGFIEVYKKDPNGKNLSGAYFTAVDQSTGDKFVIGPTNSSGYAKSGELPLGTYKVTETTFPTGYEASGTSSWTVTLTKDTPNMTITINAVNKLKTGYIEVYKKDEGGSNLAGAVFTAVNQSTKTSYTIGPTNSSGYAKSAAIPFGTYVVTETTFPPGYESSGTSTWTVTIDDNTTNRTITISAVNKLKDGYIEVYKKDEDGSPLAGAVFTAVNQSTNASYTIGPTNSSGYAKSAAIPYGTYQVTETTFPPGYEASGEYSWTVTISDSTANATITINAVNKQSPGKAQIVKTATNGGSVAGWHFEVQDSNGTVIGNFETDSTGVIAVDLNPGTYTVTEIDGEKDYWVNDSNPTRTVTVQAGETAVVTFTNQWKGKAQIIKTATNGGTVAGWHFEVKNSSGTVIGSYVTDSTGVITLDLEPGTYTVTETDGEKDYWENDPNPTKTVTVKAGQTAKVTFANKWLGKAKVIKTTTNGGKVEGWTFTIQNTSGTFVGKYTTDANGLIVANLEPGTYTVQETAVDDPYWTCDTEVKTITVKAGETASVSFENQWTGKAKIIKTLENPEAGTLEGWTFAIYKVSEGEGGMMTDYLTTVTTGEDGTILTDLDPGDYLISEELEADSLWQCASVQSQMVTVKAGQTAEVTFTNALKAAEISVYKVDLIGAPLADAEFLLEWYDEGSRTWRPVTYTDSQYPQIGGCTSAGLVDGKLTTGKDGVASFTGLYPTLQYRLTETKAPEGYQLLTEPAYEGSIPTENDLIVELTVVNAPVFELPMTGSTGSGWMTGLQLAGAVTLLAVLLYIAKKRR